MELSSILRRNRMMCPFAVPESDYRLTGERRDVNVCWFKAQNYMRENDTEVIDPLYSECTYLFTFGDCPFYAGVPFV